MHVSYAQVEGNVKWQPFFVKCLQVVKGKEKKKGVKRKVMPSVLQP